MKTCSTCKHWIEKPELKVGICGFICTGDPEDDPQEEDALMDAWHCINQATLYTKPTFGCTLHKEKQ